MPALQLHQFRVAAVGRIIAEDQEGLDVDSITKALLLHDTANIIKFKLGAFPDLCEPEGIEYWEGIRQEYIAKYGASEHKATHQITKDIGVSEKIQRFVEAVGFSNSVENLKSNNIERMICAYADQRVMPYKISSLTERLNEGRKRFFHRGGNDDGLFEKRVTALKNMETYIFKNCKIQPEDINDSSVNKTIEELETYNI